MRPLRGRELDWIATFLQICDPCGVEIMNSMHIAINMRPLRGRELDWIATFLQICDPCGVNRIIHYFDHAC